MERAAPSLLLGLAPGGGYLAARVTTRAGGLLHHLFTFAEAAMPSQPSAFLWPFSDGQCLYGCGASMMRCIHTHPRLGVTQHRALWSPDFPQPMRSIGRDRMANLGVDSMIAHDQ